LNQVFYVLTFIYMKNGLADRICMQVTYLLKVF